ncbi:Mpo1-like protein [Marinicella sp. W31]|uniref:Mpo1-like protein n=1 Tax=Marinicella sp. W31 TaxID=3023713 RepID=UPI003756D678
MPEKNTTYKSFKEFYPYYLAEHSNRVCRRLHVIGSVLVILMLIYVFISSHWWWLLSVPVIGYGFAWVGHFFFEKNKPATFQYPLYSLLGDWVMFWQVLRGQIRF